MINICIATISIIVWILIFLFKPYCYTQTRFWTNFWVTIFCIVGGCVGAFVCQSIVYLCGGQTYLF